MPFVHLFVDTNIFLNFYHFADDGLEQLEQLVNLISNDGICLHLPNQVINELARNRETKLKTANDQFIKESLPSAVPRHMQQYAQCAEYIAAIEQAKKLRSQLVSLTLADASNETLAADGLIRAVFEKATKYPEDENVFSVAIQRMQKGNPPGKNGSIGDQYNWETLLKEVPSGDLHIASKDGDYASLLNKSRPHPSLEGEWRKKKGGDLHIYSDLRAFLRKYNELLSQVVPDKVAPPPPPQDIAVAPPPPAQLEVVEEIDPKIEAAMQMLIDSGSFAATHSAISCLNNYMESLRQLDAERLIRAAVDNEQVRWIATDSDVYTFYVSLLTKHSDIDDGLFDKVVDIFGLRPDPIDLDEDI